MTSPLDNIEPRELWKHFDDIRRIPRPSGKEEKIRQHMRQVARDHDFEIKEDGAGNIVIKVPATPGHEAAPIVVIQGHMDMVCEKNADTAFDFDNDPIEVVVEGDWVTAQGTTLGADNGLGLAASLAAATDPSVVHGPLELLFTVDEETGLTGAMQLDDSMLEGRKLLNLDSEDDGVLFVGCAGGKDATLTFPITRSGAPDWVGRRIEVKGLRGGHSGLDIGDNRGNAIRILARTLAAIRDTLELSLASFEGGSAHNAIPREASAVCLVPTDHVEQLEALVAEQLELARAEYGAVEPKLAIELRPADDPPATVIDNEPAARFIDLLLALPHGAHSMSHDIEGLVETSNNMATIKTGASQIELLSSQRSSNMDKLDLLTEQIRAVARLAGGECEVGGGYPAWQPNMDSPLLAKCQAVYQEMFGKEPVVEIIHAGLECGIIGAKYEGMDMISFGPTIKNPHSPDETIEVETIGKVWDFLAALLKAI